MYRVVYDTDVNVGGNGLLRDVLGKAGNGILLFDLKLNLYFIV
jgi:hypothetical protein